MAYPPLTNSFTPPPDCLHHWTYVATPLTSSAATTIWQAYERITSATLSCYPSAFLPAYGTYSPGLACPAGYTTAEAMQSAGTSTAWCCPSAFGWDGRLGCTSLYTTSMSVVASSAGGMASAVVGPGTAVAMELQLVWQDGDEGLFRTGSATSSSSTSAETSLAAGHGHASGRGKVGAGALAGIAVGAVMGLLLLLGAVVLLLRRRRRRKGREVREVRHADSGIPELAASGAFEKGDMLSELDPGKGKTRTEMRATELPTPLSPQCPAIPELPAQHAGRPPMPELSAGPAQYGSSRVELDVQSDERPERVGSGTCERTDSPSGGEGHKTVMAKSAKERELEWLEQEEEKLWKRKARILEGKAKSGS